MSAHTLENASLLTEHFGFPPVSLVDDIINCVNVLMYKCVEEMERYLVTSLEQDQSLEGEDHQDEKQGYIDEIKTGTSKLESLLENAVDTQFDKLELYLLRNVLNMPDMDTRFFRLEHQASLVKIDKDEEGKVNLKIDGLCQHIGQELAYNDLLQQKLSDLKTLHLKVLNFKKMVTDFFNIDTPTDSSLLGGTSTTLIEALSPIDSSIEKMTRFIQEMVSSSKNGTHERDISRIGDKLDRISVAEKDVPMDT